MIVGKGSQWLGWMTGDGGASRWLVLGACGTSPMLVGSKADPGGALAGFEEHSPSPEIRPSRSGMASGQTIPGGPQPKGASADADRAYRPTYPRSGPTSWAIRHRDH